jgi:pimeloyl-ACP methyl ester carboxylesterase
VLEAGMGSWSFAWRMVQPAVSKLARVCVYNRPGLGWSEAGLKPRRGAQIAAELHQVLYTAVETGPYLLVEHSMGGIFVRQFARLYPQVVFGMVLVDSAQRELQPVGKQMRSQSSFFSFSLSSSLGRWDG